MYWVARQRRYFGTLGICDAIPLALMQLLFGKAGLAVANFAIIYLTRLVFWLWGCIDWLPDGPFDLSKEQFVPNRGHLLTYRHRIDREVRGSPQSIIADWHHGWWRSEASWIARSMRKSICIRP